MREILYKAKRIDNGEWVEGYLVKTRCNTYHDGYRIIDKDGINYDELDYYEPIFISYVIDESTICQYTGMTDKNGQKIWENDIIKEYNSNGIEWSLSQIVFADYSLNLGWCSKGIKSLNEFDKRVFDVGFGKNDACKCVVIGNIFDNAELLERKE